MAKKKLLYSKELRHRADLAYLKLATPTELMEFTNGIPWHLCCFIKVVLTGAQPQSEALNIEIEKWIDAGASSTPTKLGAVSKGSDPLTPCDHCGGIIKDLPHPAGRRMSFSLDRGFGWQNLCAGCCHTFDAEVAP